MEINLISSKYLVGSIKKSTHIISNKHEWLVSHLSMYQTVAGRETASDAYRMISLLDDIAGAEGEPALQEERRFEGGQITLDWNILNSVFFMP